MPKPKRKPFEIEGATGPFRDVLKIDPKKHEVPTSPVQPVADDIREIQAFCRDIRNWNRNVVDNRKPMSADEFLFLTDTVKSLWLDDQVIKRSRLAHKLLQCIAENYLTRGRDCHLKAGRRW